MDTCSKYQHKRSLDAGTTLVIGSLVLQRTDTGYTMSGGKYGSHTISLDSSQDRIAAHWQGYQDNQHV